MTGLQCWDTGGNQTVEITDRLCRIVGMVDTSGGSGSVNVNGGNVWAFAAYVWEPVDVTDVVNVTISGNTVSWSGGGNVTIVYGVY